MKLIRCERNVFVNPTLIESVRIEENHHRKFVVKLMTPGKEDFTTYTLEQTFKTHGDAVVELIDLGFELS